MIRRPPPTRIAGPLNLYRTPTGDERRATRDPRRRLHRPALVPRRPGWPCRSSSESVDCVDEALLASQRVPPAGLEASGYRFGSLPSRRAPFPAGPLSSPAATASPSPRLARTPTLLGPDPC